MVIHNHLHHRHEKRRRGTDVQTLSAEIFKDCKKCLSILPHFYLLLSRWPSYFYIRNELWMFSKWILEGNFHNITKIFQSIAFWEGQGLDLNSYWLAQMYAIGMQIQLLSSQKKSIHYLWQEFNSCDNNLFFVTRIWFLWQAFVW